MGKVIDFGGIRIERRDGPCDHEHVLLDTFNRMVTCGSCGKELDPFWVLVRLSDHYGAARDALLALRPSQVHEAEQSLRIPAATPPPHEPRR